jgi:hypothetical protein
MLLDEGGYIHYLGDANWRISSGRIFYSPDKNDTSEEELVFAQEHFFLPYRYLDQFDHTRRIEYDKYALLVK